MITINSIDIYTKDDYDKLLYKNPETGESLIKDEYIDKSVVELFKNHLGVKCKAIDIEFPYYDNDYLSSYYALYAKKHKNYSKKCYRLIFFADTDRTDVMGYVTLRPTHQGTHLSKIMFEPRDFLTENASLILSPEKVHYKGGECSLNVFPQMGQEGAVSACAHVSVWSVLRSFANRFQSFSSYRIADITNKAIQFDRKTIPTDGLTINQISNLFTQVGFSPVIIRRENDKFDDEIISYIESGIPLIGVISNKNHAVAMIGICDKGNTNAEMPAAYIEKVVSKDSKNYEVVLYSKFISGIYVNDDHSFPYGLVKKHPYELAKKETAISYVMRDIDYIIVPFHHRVYMHYSEAYAVFLKFLKNNASRLGWPQKILSRIFLVSSNRYKEYICNMEDTILSDVGEVLLSLESPKFMWCFEITQYDKFNSGTVDHIMLLDSTASLVDDDPVLFVSGVDCIEYKNGDNPEHMEIPLPNGMQLEAFGKLLEKVEYEDEQD